MIKDKTFNVFAGLSFNSHLLPNIFESTDSPLNKKSAAGLINEKLNAIWEKNKKIIDTLNFSCVGLFLGSVVVIPLAGALALGCLASPVVVITAVVFSTGVFVAPLIKFLLDVSMFSKAYKILGDDYGMLNNLNKSIANLLEQKNNKNYDGFETTLNTMKTELKNASTKNTDMKFYNYIESKINDTNVQNVERMAIDFYYLQFQFDTLFDGPTDKAYAISLINYFNKHLTDADFPNKPVKILDLKWVKKLAEEGSDFEKNLINSLSRVKSEEDFIKIAISSLQGVVKV